MSEHLLFCSDLARRDPAGRAIERIEGWCFGSAPILALHLHRSGQGYEQIPFGFTRPDVGRAYPEYAGAARSGFRLSTDHELAAGVASELLVETTNPSGGSELHRISVKLETRDVQTITLDRDDVARSRYREHAHSILPTSKRAFAAR